MAPQLPIVRPTGSHCCVGVLLQKLIFLLAVQASLQSPQEEKLIDDIFQSYNRLARPVAKYQDSLEVKFGLALQQIIEVDEKNEMLHTNMWLNYEWTDYKLSWNEAEYGGVKSIRLPASMIWTPDLLMYNTADEDIDSTFPTLVVVYSDGTCSWVPLGVFISSCSIDIQWFPFDDQFCTMKFGSWTYDGSEINLTSMSDQIDISTYQPSGEWDLIEAPVKRSVLRYACCPQPYIDITFTFHIRRRALNFVFNLIVPCALVSSLSLLTFILPPDAGEKISLGTFVKRQLIRNKFLQQDPSSYPKFPFQKNISSGSTV